MNIADGCESTAVINIENLNTLYSITYELNGLEWADAFSAPSSYNSCQGVTLPVAENFKNPTAFGGWYKTSDFSETAVTRWNAGDHAEDLTFYAKITDVVAKYNWTYPTSTPTLTWTGEGTVNNPYVITTAQQLADFAKMVNTGTTYSGNFIKLDDDIDLNYGYSVTDAAAVYVQWKPIGNSYQKFQGQFDGNYHTVKGLYINGSCSYAGLFGYVDGSSSVVKNVCVQGYMKVTNGYYVGGVVGRLNSGVITNCANKVEINATMGSENGYGCGGVVGYNNGTVTRCVNFTNINANMVASYKLNVGGICGCNYGKLQSSENYGNITGESSASSVCVGGIAGYNYASTISNNISCGAIKGKAKTDSFTGGIVGYSTVASYSDKIRNNAFYGAVDGTGTSIYLRGIGYVSTTNASDQRCNYFITTSGASGSGVGGSVGTFTLPTDQITAYGSTTLDYTGTLLEVLNAFYGTWVAGSDGWPVIKDISWKKE